MNSWASQTPKPSAPQRLPSEALKKSSDQINPSGPRGVEFRVEGLGFGVWGLGFGV